MSFLNNKREAEKIRALASSVSRERKLGKETVLKEPHYIATGTRKIPTAFGIFQASIRIRRIQKLSKPTRAYFGGAEKP